MNRNIYNSFFIEFFGNVKEQTFKVLGLKPANELTSMEEAFREVIKSLPCPIKVLRVNIDGLKYKNSKSDVYHFIRYDFFNLGKSSITYCGEVNFDDIEINKGIRKRFSLDDKKLDELKESKLIGYGDIKPWIWISVIPYDILKERERLVRDFIQLLWMNFSDKIFKEFGKEVNFNAKYGLTKDPILPLPMLQKKDKILDAFANVDMEFLQKNISEIQLIPNVPEEVKKVFTAAKRLFVFGYFEYYFFTISHHYAFLSLESALRNKYEEICERPSKSTNLKTIIKKLVDKGIIPKREELIYDAGRYLRNSLSHLTKPSIMLPNPIILERTAYIINQLYDVQ